MLRGVMSSSESAAVLGGRQEHWRGQKITAGSRRHHFRQHQVMTWSRPCGFHSRRPSSGRHAPRRHGRVAHQRRVSLKAETEDSGEKEYQDSFEDTTKHMLDLFTYRAVKVVLGQLFETDAPTYKALYDFSLQHKPQQSYLYLVALTKAEPEMGRRVMATREALFKEFIQRLQDGHGDSVMSNSNMQVLKDVLTQSWAAQAQVDQASDSEDYP